MTQQHPDQRAMVLGEVGMTRAELYDAFITRFEDGPRIADFFDRLLARSGLSGARGELLDIGCGTGRLLPVFAQSGWTVTGMEPDAEYLTAAQARIQPHEGIDVWGGGFLDLAASDRFDIVAAIHGPLCYVLDRAVRREALARMFRAVRPGGAVFIDVPNFLYLLHHYEAPPVQERTIRGWVVRRASRHEFDFHHAHWIHEDTLSFEKLGTRLAPLSYRETWRFAIMSASDVLEDVRSCGFEALETCMGWDSPGSEPLQGPRMLVTALKPKL